MLEQADDEDPCNRAFHAMGRVSRGGALLWTFLVAADRPFFLCGVAIPAVIILDRLGIICLLCIIIIINQPAFPAGDCSVDNLAREVQRQKQEDTRTLISDETLSM